MQIRKILTFVEDVWGEAGIDADVPLRKVAVAAVVPNRYVGRFQHDLSDMIDSSVDIGRQIAKLATQVMVPHQPVSYGKAAVVGTAGEQEHGVAMLTTAFGNELRGVAGGGKAWISSVTKRAAAGATVDVPLAHKDALYVRSHYDAMTITLPDAPLPDEIAVICCFANRGRLNARVGGLKVEEIVGADGLS